MERELLELSHRSLRVVCTRGACTFASSARTGSSCFTAACLRPGPIPPGHRSVPRGPRRRCRVRLQLVLARRPLRREGIAFVLGYALYMKAIHGAKATSDRIDSGKIAVLVRGGLMLVAYAYPADMRATHDLMRRRLSSFATGLFLAHIQITHHQYNVDPPGKRITYRSNRDGLGEGFEDSACGTTSPPTSPSPIRRGDHRRARARRLARLASTTPTPSPPHLGPRYRTSSPSPSSTRSTTSPASRPFATSPPMRLVKCREAPPARASAAAEQDRQRLPEVGLLRSRRPLHRQSEQGRTVLTRLERSSGSPRRCPSSPTSWVGRRCRMLARKQAFDRQRFATT